MLTASPLPGKPGGAPGPEASRPAAPGARIGWHLAGPRTCTGAWTGTARRPCPSGTAIAAGTTDAQCAACARADKGRQIARDAAGDDGREYLLYLAWFGPGMVKVGLTAAERGRDRLLEQGAITFTLLAAGPYTPIRQAERLASAAGLAAERVTARAKAAAWRNLPPPAERARMLTASREQVSGCIPWHGQVTLLPPAITDQAAEFGLTGELPGGWREVTAISEDAALSGTARLAVGRRLLLDTPAGLLLCDMRRVAGRVIRPGTGLDVTGLTLASGPPAGCHDSQQPLF